MPKFKPKRSKKQKKIDNAEMVILMRRGWTISMLAEKFGIRPAQVHYDFKQIIKSSQVVAEKDLPLLIQAKLEEYGEIKREAWQAWEESKKVSTTRTKRTNNYRKNKDGEPCKEVETITETQTGDVAYLRIVSQCLEAERELLGLDPAEEVNINDNVIDWSLIHKELESANVDTVEEKINSLLRSPQRIIETDHRVVSEEIDEPVRTTSNTSNSTKPHNKKQL